MGGVGGWWITEVGILNIFVRWRCVRVGERRAGAGLHILVLLESNLNNIF